MRRWPSRAQRQPQTSVTISIVGTNDLHGRLFTDDQGRGGLTVLGGYIDNLRAARAADGGAVLVLDAGDTFQGGIESNLSEGLDGRRRLQRDRLYGARASAITISTTAPSIRAGRSRQWLPVARTAARRPATCKAR